MNAKENALRDIYNDYMDEFKGERRMLSGFGTSNQEAYFGAYLAPVTSAMFGVTDKWCIGRLIQIRKNAGAFGSDMFTLRLVNGGITPFENESFWIIEVEYKTRLDELFEPSIVCDNWDDPIEGSIGTLGIDYCDNPDKRYIGFIIESEK